MHCRPLCVSNKAQWQVFNSSHSLQASSVQSALVGAGGHDELTSHCDDGKSPRTHLNGYVRPQNYRFGLRDPDLVYRDDIYKKFKAI
jgi:hypothetical protein